METILLFAAIGVFLFLVLNVLEPNAKDKTSLKTIGVILLFLVIAYFMYPNLSPYVDPIVNKLVHSIPNAVK